MLALPLVLTSLIFISFIVVISTSRFAARPLLDRLSAGFVLTCVQIVVTEIALGWAGLLYRWPLVAVNLGISGLLYYLVRPGADVPAAVFREIVAMMRSGRRLLREYPTITVMVLWLVLLVIYAASIAWILPPMDWDSLRYHLPIVAQIIQNHGIVDVPTDTVFINTYPKNFELIFLWWILLSGSDQWVNSTQIPFFLISIVVVYRLARLTDLSRQHSLLGAMLMASAPVMLQQLTSTMIDVMFTALAMLAAWGFYRYVRSGDMHDLLLSGMAAGLVAGGKGSGVVWPVVIAVLVVMATGWRAHGLGKWLKPFLAFCVPAFLLSFHWYAKNWWVYGNPIEPYQLNILGHEVFRGSIDNYEYLVREKLENLSPRIIEKLPAAQPPNSPIQAMWYAWHEPLFTFSSFGKMGGLGSPWFILLLPALPIAAVLAWLNRRRTLWWLYGVLLTPFVLFINYQWITRYGLFVLALGIVAFVMILDEFPRLGRPLRITALVLFVFSSAHGSLNRHATPGKLQAYLTLPYVERITQGEGVYNINNGTSDLMRWWRQQETAGSLLQYHANSWIFTYPLWNEHFSNRVEYLPKATSIEQWRQATIAADWLLLSDESQEAMWTEKIGTFRKVYDDDSFIVYRNVR